MTVTVFDFFYNLLKRPKQTPPVESPAVEPEATSLPVDPEWPWVHFSPEELACKHCGALPDELDVEFLDKLELLRASVGKPLRVNSGHRCRAHNLAVGGAAYSQHKNLAVDVALAGHDELALFDAAKQLGFLGIGLGGTFIHLDMRRKIDGHQPKRELTIWYYNKKGKEKWQELLNS